MYDQMRKNVAVDDQAQDEKSDDEGCTVEEVQEDDIKASVEVEQDEQSEEKGEEKDWKDKFADELNKIEHEPESEFVSNLEELD